VRERGRKKSGAGGGGSPIAQRSEQEECVCVFQRVLGFHPHLEH
jgi:mevalonate kinase